MPDLRDGVDGYRMPDVFEHRRETAVQLAHRDALFDRETRAVACRGHRGHLGIRDVQFNLEAVRAERDQSGGEAVRIGIERGTQPKDCRIYA